MTHQVCVCSADGFAEGWALVAFPDQSWSSGGNRAENRPKQASKSEQDAHSQSSHGC
jgi:hypothetical protein